MSTLHDITTNNHKGQGPPEVAPSFVPLRRANIMKRMRERGREKERAKEKKLRRYQTTVTPHCIQSHKGSACRATRVVLAEPQAPAGPHARLPFEYLPPRFQWFLMFLQAGLGEPGPPSKPTAKTPHLGWVSLAPPANQQPKRPTWAGRAWPPQQTNSQPPPPGLGEPGPPSKPTAKTPRQGPFLKSLFHRLLLS